MMSAPDARTSSGRIALTVAAVPTGMNAGVRISPRSMAMVPARAAPSVAVIEKAKRVTRGRLAAHALPPKFRCARARINAAYRRHRPVHFHRRRAALRHHDHGALAAGTPPGAVPVREGAAFLRPARSTRARQGGAPPPRRGGLSRPFLSRCGGRAEGRRRLLGVLPLYARAART